MAINDLEKKLQSMPRETLAVERLANSQPLQEDTRSFSEKGGDIGQGAAKSIVGTISSPLRSLSKVIDTTKRLSLSDKISSSMSGLYSTAERIQQEIAKLQPGDPKIEELKAALADNFKAQAIASGEQKELEEARSQSIENAGRAGFLYDEKSFEAENPQEALGKGAADLAQFFVGGIPKAVITAGKSKPIQFLESIVREGLRDSAVGAAQSDGDLGYSAFTGVTGAAGRPILYLAGRGFVGLSKVVGGSKAFGSISDTKAVRFFREMFTSVANTLKKNYGKVGEDLVTRMNRADLNTQNMLGRILYVDSRFDKMSREEAYNLSLYLRGLKESGAEAAPLQPGLIVNKGSQESFSLNKQNIEFNREQFYRAGFDDIANMAQDAGLQVRRPVTPDEYSKFVPFQKAENYFPQQFPELKTVSPGGRLRNAVIQNSVDSGYFETVEEATGVLDDLIEIYKKDGAGISKENGFVQYLIRTKQATDVGEAKRLIDQMIENKSLAKLGSSLENAKVVDNPFFNPYADEVFISYMSNSLTRLSLVDELGVSYKGSSVDFPVVQKAIDEVRQTQGRVQANNFKKLLEVALERLDNSSSFDEVSRWLRSFNTLKLSYSAIPNSTQGFLNSLLKADMKAAFKGVFGAFTKYGKQIARESGADAMNIVNQALAQAGQTGRATEKFLKAVGFTQTEIINRRIASLAGKDWASRVFEKALKEKGTYWKSVLEELGINAQKALSRGKLTDNELLKAALNFSNKTQFLSRPLDMPLFASNAVGKVIWQFKTFIFNQTEFVIKQNLVNEWRRGGRGKIKAARNLLVLGTIYPMVGEVVADIKSLITGSTRPTKWLDRYIENIASVGAAGIMLDMLNASEFDRWSELIGGPSISSFTSLLDKLDEPDKFMKELINQTGFLRPVSNYLKDNNNPDRETFLETIGDFLGN